MRDHIRERDLEQLVDSKDGHIRVDVDNRGIATVTIRRDLLDELADSEHQCDHSDCADSFEMEIAYEDGVEAGRQSVIRELKQLGETAA